MPTAARVQTGRSSRERRTRTRSSPCRRRRRDQVRREAEATPVLSTLLLLPCSRSACRAPRIRTKDRRASGRPRRVGAGTKQSTSERGPLRRPLPPPFNIASITPTLDPPSPSKSGPTRTPNPSTRSNPSTFNQTSRTTARRRALCTATTTSSTRSPPASGSFPLLPPTSSRLP